MVAAGAGPRQTCYRATEFFLMGSEFLRRPSYSCIIGSLTLKYLLSVNALSADAITFKMMDDLLTKTLVMIAEIVSNNARFCNACEAVINLCLRKD